jgi:uncharacterized protein
MSIFYKTKSKDNNSDLKTNTRNLPSLQVGNTKVNVEIASSVLEKAEGLSGRENLSENSGMLFVFNTKTKPGFWMIDMKFPLDMIWISNGKVVSISENAEPEPGKSPGQLKKYFPTEPIDYVLEVNGGFSRKNNIRVGDSVTINF